MYSDSSRTSLNLSNNFPRLYLRFDTFLKYDAKVVVLFCPVYRELTIRIYTRSLKKIVTMLWK